MVPLQEVFTSLKRGPNVLNWFHIGGKVRRNSRSMPVQAQDETTPLLGVTQVTKAEKKRLKGPKDSPLPSWKGTDQTLVRYEDQDAIREWKALASGHGRIFLITSLLEKDPATGEHHITVDVHLAEDLQALANSPTSLLGTIDGDGASVHGPDGLVITGMVEPIQVDGGKIQASLELATFSRDQPAEALDDQESGDEESDENGEAPDLEPAPADEVSAEADEPVEADPVEEEEAAPDSEPAADDDSDA